jgi:hypothetical protein
MHVKIEWHACLHVCLTIFLLFLAIKIQLSLNIMETFTLLYTIIPILKIITNTFRYYKNNFKTSQIQKFKQNYKIYNQFIMTIISAYNIFNKIRFILIHPLILIDNKLFIFVLIVVHRLLILLTIHHILMTIDPHVLLIIMYQMLAQ